MKIGWLEILLILCVILLFGVKRIPEIARAMGQALNEFKKAKDSNGKKEDEPEKKSLPPDESNSN